MQSTAKRMGQALARAGLPAVLALVIAYDASAQSGLQRFESEVKPQLELKQFTYGSASALGSAGFVLNNVVAVLPADPTTGDKESTIKIDKITVDEIDFERLTKGNKDDIPRFAKLKLEGMSADDGLVALLGRYGVPQVPADFALDYRLDTATKVLTLAKLEINLRGQARLALAAVIDGIDDKSSNVQGSKDDGRLRNASIDLHDSGLIAKLLPAIAREQGSKAEAFVMVASAAIAGFAADQGAVTLKALDALASFIQDWKQPKGPIKIAIQPAKTTGLNDLDKLGEPNALTEIFGLTVDYAGTRAGASGAVAAATAPQAGNDGAKELTGGEAWLTVVGNTLTGKVDGEVIFEHYRKDGTLTLMQDSELTQGKWTIEGERVCFKYPDEDKECYSVRRLGDQVTLTGSRGKGLRLTLLPGNPQNL